MQKLVDNFNNLKLLIIFREITQSQSQLVVYKGNHFFYSPYETVTQSTTVLLPSATTESYSKFGGASKDDDTIKYGDHKEFENVAPLSQVSLLLCTVCV